MRTCATRTAGFISTDLLQHWDNERYRRLQAILENVCRVRCRIRSLRHRLMAKQLDERVRILSTWPPGTECAQVHICYPLRQTAAPAAQKEKHNGRTFGDKRCRGSRKWTSDELTPWPNMYWLADPETVRQQACICSGADGAMQSSLSAACNPACLHAARTSTGAPSRAARAHGVREEVPGAPHDQP